jgi:dTDP-4-amino-4,6-dideoxygalactose transaminase
MPNKIYLSSPHLGSEERTFVKEAFDTNWIAPLGPNVNGFEEDLQLYSGVAHAAALSSGTAAIHLALLLLDVQPGDYVLCQSMTFCGSANPIAYTGATPVFIDSETDSWNMSPRFLAEAIATIQQRGEGARIKAVMPVHLYGMPANLDAIQSICDEHGIPMVEDAAESLGATWRGRQTGSFGRMGVYSFNGNKIITTSGGGALVSDDKELIDRSRFLATQARDPAPHYQHTTIGYNYRLSNVLAGIGRGQMRVLDERIAQRRANFERYRDYFSSWEDKGLQVTMQPEREEAFSNRWLTCLLVDPEECGGITRETIRLTLAEDSVEARPLWKPMHLQPVFAEAEYFGDGTCEKLFEQGLCLPSGSNLTEEEWERILGALDGVLMKNI